MMNYEGAELALAMFRGCISVVFAMMFAIASASACSGGGSPSSNLHHTELVSQTKNIVIATAKRAPNSSGVEFQVKEVLKGEAKEIVHVVNGIVSGPNLREIHNLNEEISSSFNDHRSLLFWNRRISNTSRSASCQIWASFEIGKTYLLFLGQPHVWGYEEISSPDTDMWLSAVRKLVNKNSPLFGASVTFYEYLQMTDAVFSVKQRNCGGKKMLARKIHGNIGRHWEKLRKKRDLFSIGDCLEKVEVLVVAPLKNPLIVSKFGYIRSLVVDGVVCANYLDGHSELKIKPKSGKYGELRLMTCPERGQKGFAEFIRKLGY